MAKADLNLAYDAELGRKSHYVYRRRKGKMYFARRRDQTVLTPTEEGIRNRFLFAAKYANRVLADPDLRAKYEPIAAAQKRTVRELAMTDYLRSPRVVGFELRRFSGAAGSLIQVAAAKEGGELASVHVEVRGGNDTLLEEGEAVSLPEGWVYTVTGTYAKDTPIKITATAVDQLGNTASKITPWP